MICEPIALVRDDKGYFHFSDDGLPFKTIIDVQNIPFGEWMKLHRASVIIELDGRTVTYDRVAMTPEGYWICRMRVDPATVYAQQS